MYDHDPFILLEAVLDDLFFLEHWCFLISSSLIKVDDAILDTSRSVESSSYWIWALEALAC